MFSAVYSNATDRVITSQLKSSFVSLEINFSTLYCLCGLLALFVHFSLFVNFIQYRLQSIA